MANDSKVSEPLQDLAAVRAGLVLVETAPLSEIIARLEPRAGAGAPFRHTAREIIVLAAWRAGDVATVRRWSDQVREDAETPPGVRALVDTLMALATESGKS